MRPRFAFGRNWARYLPLIDESRISAAADSLQAMLGDLNDKSFLDVGSGSGLSSLAAVRLGARVVSFDYDAEAVACTETVRTRYAPRSDWVVLEGSVLDKTFLESLGSFDVVYSWGVLHHTGAMWDALRNIFDLVNVNGRLFIAIYNDQGFWSRQWRRIKKAYVQSPPSLRPVVLGTGWLLLALLHWRSTIRHLTRTVRESPRRGMDRTIDLIDWVGGYPFEVASPAAVFDFCHGQGFALEGLTTVGGGLGCNEFVFAKQHHT